MPPVGMAMIAESKSGPQNLRWKLRVSKELNAMAELPKPYHTPSLLAEVAVSVSPQPFPPRTWSAQALC